MTSDQIGLPEPARQQVLIVADAVLGSMAADEVPAALRPIARFTPSKRLRLGATALAGTLDTDAAFRERVAETAEAAAPELAAALRAGAAGEQLAADPLDVAVLAYLLRPDGWQEAVAAAGRRWRDDHATDDSAERQRLHDEVAALRTAAKGETGRSRDAVREATATLEAEVTALRKTVRDRTRELRAAERERDAARTAAENAGTVADGRIAELAAAHVDELTRLRERVAEAELAAQAARRGSRTERDIDDARLWLLVDTLVQAATGVRRELSLAAPDARPADGVADGLAVPGSSGGQRVHDLAALNGVLALPHLHVVVDGYNVSKSGFPELPLVDQRARLATALAALAARTGAETTVVWDGADVGAAARAAQPAPRGVRVLFSASDEIADDVIRRLVAAEPAGRPVLVVTSDQEIVRDTARAGVWSAPSALLLNRL